MIGRPLCILSPVLFLVGKCQKSLLFWNGQRVGCILEVLRKRRGGVSSFFHLDVNDRKRVRSSFKKSPKGHSSERDREKSCFFFPKMQRYRWDGQETVSTHLVESSWLSDDRLLGAVCFILISGFRLPWPGIMPYNSRWSYTCSPYCLLRIPLTDP